MSASLHRRSVYILIREMKSKFLENDSELLHSLRSIISRNASTENDCVIYSLSQGRQQAQTLNVFEI